MLCWDWLQQLRCMRWWYGKNCSDRICWEQQTDGFSFQHSSSSDKGSSSNFFVCCSQFPFSRWRWRVRFCRKVLSRVSILTSVLVLAPTMLGKELTGLVSIWTATSTTSTTSAASAASAASTAVILVSVVGTGKSRSRSTPRSSRSSRTRPALPTALSTALSTALCALATATRATAATAATATTARARRVRTSDVLISALVAILAPASFFKEAAGFVCRLCVTQSGDVLMPALVAVLTPAWFSKELADLTRFGTTSTRTSSIGSVWPRHVGMSATFSPFAPARLDKKPVVMLSKNVKCWRLWCTLYLYHMSKLHVYHQIIKTYKNKIIKRNCSERKKFLKQCIERTTNK